MEARLSEIASVADQKERTAQYRDVVTECLAGGGNVEGLKAMVTHMMSDDVPLVISRQILQTLCQEVVTTLPAEQQRETAAFALEKMSPRVMSFDEQVSVLREGLSKLYQNDAEWSRAAKMLAGIDLDSGTRVLSDEYKLRKCVQIAMLYLEDDDAVVVEQRRLRDAVREVRVGHLFVGRRQRHEVEAAVAAVERGRASL